MSPATGGNWGEVWSTIDTGQKAKAGEGANDVGADERPGLFGDDAAGGVQAAE